MPTGLPAEAPPLAEIVGTLLVVLALIAGIDGTPALLVAAFPEGPGAQSIGPRMTICGRVGKYRRYCGLPEDFVGPVEDPRRQWNRRTF